MLKICINQIKFDAYERGRCDFINKEDRKESIEKINKSV